ncbi:hypothetical protein BDW62DRAFT_115931 [Aspergillus aurantiobrunneus]
MALKDDRFEDDQGWPDTKPTVKKDELPCVRPVSSGLESNNGDSIYEALRATSNGDEASGAQNGDNTLERVDARMAANLAMFYSASSTRVHGLPCGGSTPNPPECDTDEIDRPPRTHLLADKLRIASTGEVTAWSLPEGLPAFQEEQQPSPVDRPNNSEDDSMNLASPSPRWLLNIESPVNPAHPEYPPPVRLPTPPGLPSFGSEEARSYDFRIRAPHPIPNRTESLLRRLFQRRSPSPPQPQANRQQRTRRVFAEDGTAVLGSFPQRQSGHGTNASRKIDDHPFHQGNLPLAQSDGANVGGYDAVSQAPGRTEVSPSPDSYTDGEATLAWLNGAIQNIPASQSPAPPGNTLDSTLLNPGTPNKRADSYQTCVSRLPGSNAPLGIVRQARSMLPESFSLVTTQSAVPSNPQNTNTAGGDRYDTDPPDLWKLVMKRAKSILCCCCGSEDASDYLNPSGALNPSTTNTTTQDTYVTARDQPSNESQQPQPTAAIDIHPAP